MTVNKFLLENGIFSFDKWQYNLQFQKITKATKIQGQPAVDFARTVKWKCVTELLEFNLSWNKHVENQQKRHWKTVKCTQSQNKNTTGY